MKLFRKKRQTASTPINHGFRHFVKKVGGDHSYLADYISWNGEFDEVGFERSETELDINEAKKALLVLYSVFLGIKLPEFLGGPTEGAGIVDFLPVGVVIRRVRPKTAGSNWRAQYRPEGTIYYGETLDKALRNLIAHNEKVHEQVTSNVQAVVNTVGNLRHDLPVAHNGFNYGVGLPARVETLQGKAAEE